MQQSREAAERTLEKEPQSEPDHVSDADRPVVKETNEARQGKPVRDGAIRRVLMISLGLVIVAFALIYFVFAS